MNIDAYNDTQKLVITAMSTEKLIDEFNLQVLNKGWTTTRAIHDALVLDTLKKRGIDMSAIDDGKSISFKHRIKLNEEKTKIIIEN